MKEMITYKELLEKIKDQQNHLLIANGFNYGLGVNTGYNAIFEKMITKNSIYEEAKSLFSECGYDIEEFAGKQEAYISNNPFLQKYIKNKIKYDFMLATHEIVKAKIKHVYAEKNEGVFLLLQNFTNFFTLNYDSFLYLLLLKYKPLDNKGNNAIAFHPRLKFIEEDMNKNSNDIYSEIKRVREEGTLKITLGSESNSCETPLNRITKSHFTTEVKAYSKNNNKGWKVTDINRVVGLIIKEEQSTQLLKNVDDGSVPHNLFGGQLEYVFENKATQNLFFLHGAFHIYQEGKEYKKITQKSDKALYDKLEEVLNNDGQDVVCVFQQANKMDEIQNNEYLQNCLDKLGEISGNIVIIGSSLAENDNHIFERISNSGVHTVYVSACKKESEKIQKKATSLFPSKNIFLFDAETISYEKPQEIN